MQLETLDYDLSDNVATITFNRPQAYNALSHQMSRELHDLAIECTSNKEVRAVVLTGSGDKAYCAGGDVASFAENIPKLPSMLLDMTSYLHMAISRFAWMDAPVIAAVNGVAAGAGLSLMAFTDLAIAADTATFTSAYTAIGMSPDGSSTYYLPRLIGQRRTMDLYLTNRVLTAEEALDWGLINRIVPQAEVKQTAREMALKLAKGPTGAYGNTKRLVLAAASDSLESQMEAEARSIAERAGSPDGIEGITAFAEKRKAHFTGER